MSAPCGLVNCNRDTGWIGCVDFGTAFSKFAMVRAVDREELEKSDIQALPVGVAPDYRAANEWLLPSVLFVTEDAILFGEEAQRMAIRSHGSAREAFSSPKQYLSTDDFDLYDGYLRKEIDPTGKFTPRGTMSAARSEETATPIKGGLVLVVGGYDGVSSLKSAELYRP